MSKAKQPLALITLDQEVLLLSEYLNRSGPQHLFKILVLKILHFLFANRERIAFHEMPKRIQQGLGSY